MSLTKVHNRLIKGAFVNLDDFGAIGDGVTDDTAAIQSAADYASSSGKMLYIPTPSNFYLISSTITFDDINVLGESATGNGTAVSIGNLGTSQFKATTEFTAFRIYSSRNIIENIGVEFVLSSSATSAVGFEFGSTSDANDNLRLSKFSQSNVRNAYNGFQTVSSTATVAVGVFELCTSTFHQNIGFNFVATGGSTNLTFINCFSQCISGGSGKGFIFDSIKDISMIGCSVDACVDVGIQVTDGDTFSADNISFELPKLSSSDACLIKFTTISADIGRIGIQSLEVDCGGGNNCYLVSPALSNYNTSVGEIRLQGTTTTSGTLYKYEVRGAIDNGGLIINDSNCLPSEIDYNGFNAYVNLNGKQQVPSFAFILGSWNAGDFVWESSPTEAGTGGNKYVTLGWSRLTTGSGNVLNTDWVEARVLTGN